MFLISWKGLGVLKGALELHKDGEGLSRLPHDASNRERAPVRAMTTKGPPSNGAGGVQSQDHGSV